MDIEDNAAGLYEVVWMDDDEVPRRRRFFCQSASEEEVFSAGKRMAKHSRFGIQYVITVRSTTPDW